MNHVEPVGGNMRLISMGTLHGILAELGIEPPLMHPEREAWAKPEWIVDRPFVPVQGESYELAYGNIPAGAGQRPVIKRIRADGPAPANWFDLDEGMPLDPGLHAYPVRGFRRIG